MNTKLCALLAGASLVALAGMANAAEPVPLSDKQLDGVTAGAAAVGTGQALALGDFLTLTQTVTATDAVTSLTITNANGSLTQITGSALGQSLSVAAAASALFQAAVATSSQSAATLP
jgi:hypothetical protein